VSKTCLSFTFVHKIPIWSILRLKICFYSGNNYVISPSVSNSLVQSCLWEVLGSNFVWAMAVLRFSQYCSVSAGKFWDSSFTLATIISLKNLPTYNSLPFSLMHCS
jgi:hypothetical protein